MNYKNDLLLYFVLVLISTAMMLVVEQFYNPPSSAVLLDGSWSLETGDSKEIAGSPPFYYSGTEDDFDQGIYSFTTQFNYDESAEFSRPVIVFPYNAGNGIRLSINGQVIDLHGDLTDGRASVWNTVHVFTLSPEGLSPVNDVKAEIYGLYEAGFSKVPYIVDAAGTARFRIFLFSWGETFFKFLIGSIFLLSFTFIITGVISFNFDKPKIYLGLALFFIAVFLLDYTFLENVIVSYLVFKKIVISAHFTGMIFFVLYINHMAGMEKKIFPKFIVFCFSFILITIIFHPGEMTYFRRYYSFVYLSDLLLFINLLSFFIRRITFRYEVKIIFAGGVVALSFSFHDVICLFLDGGQVFLSQYGIVFLFLSGAGVVISEILKTYLENIRNKRLAERYYTESVQDPLTGAYNRKILSIIESDLTTSFSALVFDLNDFKQVNDNYGHAAGDLVLKKLVEIIRMHVRNDDFVIRIGGDEFLVIMPGCLQPVAEQQGLNVSLSLASELIEHKGNKIKFGAAFGTASGEAGISMNSVIELADNQMYQNKKKAVCK